MPINAPARAPIEGQHRARNLLVPACIKAECLLACGVDDDVFARNDRP
jgi:hypothetical protein